jgi:putative addiction module CopG family antidote
MDIRLTQESARFINEKLARGEFHNAAEVIEEALRALEEREREETGADSPEMTVREWTSTHRKPPKTR